MGERRRMSDPTVDDRRVHFLGIPCGQAKGEAHEVYRWTYARERVTCGGCRNTLAYRENRAFDFGDPPRPTILTFHGETGDVECEDDQRLAARRLLSSMPTLFGPVTTCPAPTQRTGPPNDFQDKNTHHRAPTRQGDADAGDPVHQDRQDSSGAVRAVGLTMERVRAGRDRMDGAARAAVSAELALLEAVSPPGERLPKGLCYIPSGDGKTCSVAIIATLGRDYDAARSEAIRFLATRAPTPDAVAPPGTGIEASHSPQKNPDPPAPTRWEEIEGMQAAELHGCGLLVFRRDVDDEDEERWAACVTPDPGGREWIMERIETEAEAKEEAEWLARRIFAGKPTNASTREKQ